MKDKIKSLMVIGIMTLIISALAVKVNATGSFNLTVTANKTELKPGDEVTITVGVSDINVGENGINALEGKIEYNKNIFEDVKSSSVQSMSNWSTTYNDEASSLNGKFLSANVGAGIKENTQLFKITFKLKQEIENVTDTQIYFKNIASNDGTNKVNSETKSVKLKINAPNNNNNTSTEEPKKDTPKDNTISTQGQTSGINSDKTKTNKSIPKTGKSIAVVIAVCITTFVIIILGIKNRSMRDIK